MEVDKALLIARIEELAKEKGVNLNTAFIESRVGKNFKSNLSTANPSEGKIRMLATYFGVSVDYLLGNEKEKPADEGELTENVVIFHRDGKTVTKKFSKEQMEILAKMLDALSEEEDG